MTIGGNLHAMVQVKQNGSKNKIGEREPIWVDCMDLLGWLDLSGGDSKHINFHAKIQESTHIFICEFVPLTCLNKEVTSENARMVIGGNAYEILLIDNPMQMNEHLELYLKYVGGGLGVG